MSRSLVPCALLAAAVALAPRAPRAGSEGAPESPPDAGLPPLPDLQTITGPITHALPGERAITVAARSGPVTITYDRNTTIYGQARLGSVRDLVVGAPVRAEFGPERHAYWIEVLASSHRDARREHAPPDGGTAEGPPVLPAPPAGADRTTAASSAVGTGDGAAVPVPAGPAPPERTPGPSSPPAPPGATPVPDRP